MLNFSDLQTALNVSEITSLLGTYDSEPAIFDDPLVPQDYVYNDTLGTINYYLSVPYDPRLDYIEYNITVNCRAKKNSVSISIVNAVLTKLNRVHFTNYFMTCTVLPTISPQDDTDNYNNIVNVNFRKH